mgnify:CR=1 FL=1
MENVNIFYLVCAAVCAVMLIYYDRRRRRLSSFFKGAASGLVSLFAVNLFGAYIGAAVPLNIFNLCGSAVLGVPFVVFVTVLKIIGKI